MPDARPSTSLLVGCQESLQTLLVLKFVKWKVGTYMGLVIIRENVGGVIAVLVLRAPFPTLITRPKHEMLVDALLAALTS